MRKAWWFAALGLASTLSAPALADEEGTGAEVGFRTGYAVPLGKVGSGGGDLSDGIKGQVPLWFDLGYRVTPNIMIGAYFAYGIGIVGDGNNGITLCGNGADCSAKDLRLGAQFHYHFTPDRTTDPWIGAGIGYEWLTLGASAGGQSASITAHGFEMFNIQGGLDFKIFEESNAGIGPFIALSFAQYSKLSCDVPRVAGVQIDCGGDINSTVHEWLTFGVRGTFVP